MSHTAVCTDHEPGGLHASACCPAHPGGRPIRRYITPHMPRLFAVVAIAAGLMAAAPSYAALTAPTPTMPSFGSTQDQTPVFGWSAVTGAASYNFELATDANFSSKAYTLNGTKNTRLTLPSALQDDDY